MKKSGLKHFILIFILFPSFVGCYSLFFDNIEFKSNNAGEGAINEILSNNLQNDRSDIVYTPIESIVNLSRIYDRVLDPLGNATNTIEYDLRTDSERVLSRGYSFSGTSPSIIEPFEGILDTDYVIEDSSEEEGLRASYVFPPDDRQKITTTTSYPWRTICKLYIEAQDNSYWIGSGAIIDNFHVLTCGHCVYLHDAGGWAAEIIVVPGMDGDNEPYGIAYATNMRTYTGWTQSEMVEHDWAVLTLDRSIGLLTGWMGRQTEDSSNSIYTGTLNLAGYPGDLDSGESMYFDSDVGDRADEYNHWYWMDTAGGQSGSPVWRYDGSNRYILSIFAYEYIGGIDANFGTRLNTEKFDRINTWLAEDNSTIPDDKPDLLDRDYYSGVSSTEIVKGETNFEIYCDVKNEGTAAASSFDVSFYFSENSIISSSDYLIGSITINNLDSYSYVASDWMGVIPTEIPDGSYYVGWIIDSGYVIDEFDENNNNVLLSYPMIEIKSPVPDLGGIFITVFIIIGIISLVSITLFVIAKSVPDLRFVENTYNTYREQPKITSNSELIKPSKPPGSKFCTNCGYKRYPKSKFCVNCGYKLNTY
ncbi:MAG: CARDB domain-containing protein [Promethearchaeota archaeon]